MFTITNNLVALLLIITLANSFTCVVSWKRRKAKGGIYITLALMGITFWALSAGLNYGTIPIPAKVFLAKSEYTFYTCTFTFLAMFALTYAGHEDWLNIRAVKAFFLITPISNILLAWTNDWHGWLWKGFTRSNFGNNTIIFEHGPGYYWAALTGCLMILIIILPFWQASHEGVDYLSRRQARLLFISSILSIISTEIYLLGTQRLKGLDWAPIICSFLGVLFIMILYGTRLLDLVPIARFTMIEQMSESVLVLDENDCIVDFNPAAQEIFSINQQHLGKKINVIMARYPEVINLFSSNSNKISQLTIIHEDKARVFDTHLTLILDNSGKTYGRLLILSDITKHHQSEQALVQRLFEIQELNKNLQESQAQVVAQQRRLAKMEERKRLGRDMHDSVNQSVHSVMMFADALVSLLKKGQINEAISVAERIHQGGKQALKEIRLLVFETQSQKTDEITDLIAALQERFNFVENRVGVQTDIILDGTLASLPPEWNENLFWITIEALNNALKHAQTNEVEVIIRCKDKHVEVKIVDKGIGFDPALSNGGGMGMRTMRERTELLGGQLSITSSPGHGTCISFHTETREYFE